VNRFNSGNRTMRRDDSMWGDAEQDLRDLSLRLNGD